MQGECPALILKVQERMGFLVGRLTMARDWQSLQERDSRRVKWASAGHRLNFVTNSIGVGLPKLAGLLPPPQAPMPCLLYTSDAADDMQCVDLGGRRILSIPVDRFANLLLWARDKASETKFHTRHSARHKHRFREWGRETNQTAESKIGGGRLSTTGIVQLPRSC